MKTTDACTGEMLLNRAADGRDYPNTGGNPFARIATRDDGCDDNGEPLCSEQPEQAEPTPWQNFQQAVIGIARAQNPHHLDTEH